ncbi:DUF4974 domain-containing protein [Mucilaginibacter daejeonensis]|uniref:FecR family protein n=1 Tax=Mucilaginibacter daejeonensis TaxID=398049 RepID=UPI001D17A221|nr:FecR family protein [Mucilaginibacter daejeonensis]UEG51678.1 DUF4974 domain-containing protein [Mucilaginibacter daejeonensis]
MTSEEFLVLYEKFLAGECTAEELRKLEEHKDDFELKVHPWTAQMGDKHEVKQKLTEGLMAQVKMDDREKSVPVGRLAVAASILVLISVGALLLFKAMRGNTEQRAQLTTQQPVKSIIKPGSNKAILILANGNMVDLDGSNKGPLSDQGGAKVTKMDKGQVIYQSDHTVKENDLTAYNTIATPRGGQYQITLSDGTLVWLNAASSIKFPTVFNGKDRVVELTGEAYFEVAKNREHPFKVISGGVNVNVLGTHFNVMAYPDETSIQTTLIEGAVRLETNDATTLLDPGQQGLLSHGAKRFSVKQVNVNDIVSWKDGVFTFNNEDIHTIMRKISRWYDVDVDYKGQLTSQNFGGSVSRFKDISSLLKTLELTGTIHFKIDGRRITVMP